MIEASTLTFLKSLAKNNNKAWFDSHRNEYDLAKENFRELITKILEGISRFDVDLKEIDAKQSIFRQNRDIRFSKDKTPYKTNFGASMSRGGRKSNFAVYYIHIEPGGKSFAGGGIWMPEPSDLKKVRQEIDYSFEEFDKIVSSKAFKKEFKGLEDAAEYKLSKVPKGYEKDNPAAEYLKLKSILATRNIADEEVTKPGFVKSVLKSFEVLMPMVKFINRSVE